MSDAEFGDPRLPQRFWAKVHVDAETGCWLWTGQRNSSGYGRFRFDGRGAYAHRSAYSALVESLPAPFMIGDPEIDHVCRVRSCCNPAHLELVAHRVNMLRGDTVIARNAQRTHCARRGHPLEDGNLRAQRGIPGRGTCSTCIQMDGVDRAAVDRDARRALGMTKRDIQSTFGRSRRVAERILAAVESGIAPEVIVASARAAHAAIRAENVDAWLDTLRNERGAA